MILQVGTDASHVMHDVNTHVSQMLPRTDTRQLQQLRGAIGSTRNNHLPSGMSHFQPFRSPEFNAGRALSREQDAGGVGFGPDRQVRPALGHLQVGGGRAPAPLVLRGGLVVAAAFLLRAVEIRIEGDSSLLAGLQQRLGDLPLIRLV